MILLRIISIISIVIISQFLLTCDYAIIIIIIIVDMNITPCRLPPPGWHPPSGQDIMITTITTITTIVLSLLLLLLILLLSLS